MRIKLANTILAAVTLFVVAPAACASRSERTILFGMNYLPQITCVEDFSPYWITDNWTEQRMVEDLKIMKAIGCSLVRFHMFPALPGKSTRPGVAAEKFLPMLDLGVSTANDLGLLVHLDIAQDLEKYGEEGVRFYVPRYRGKIESYQIGDELYHYGRNPERLKFVIDLFKLIHELDPDAKVSIDLLIPDLARLKEEMPELYNEMDMLMRQYYPVTDHRGWNEVYIQDLVDHMSNPTGRKTVMEIAAELRPELVDRYGEHEAYGTFYDHPLYAGSYAWFDKEVWITEITAHGYWQWGNVVSEEKRAEDWPNVIDAIASADNKVTRVYHHCFRDKMSWREYGKGQCGIVYYDGAPREATSAFKKTAVKYSPPDSPMRALDCEIERVVVEDGASSVEMKIHFTNKTDAVLEIDVVLELPVGTLAASDRFKLSIPPKSSRSHQVSVNTSNMQWGNNHAFARVNIPQGLLYGWGIIARPKRLELGAPPQLKKDLQTDVRYVQGPEAVQDFLDQYADDLAVVIGPGIGDDAEMGYRLKSIIQALRSREVPMRPSILAADVLNRPLIVIGDPKFNLVSRSIETELPEDQIITTESPGSGVGLINVVTNPLGSPSIHGRNNKQAEMLGYYFGHCPAALYLAGSDHAGTKAAVYEIISRVWGRGFYSSTEDTLPSVDTTTYMVPMPDGVRLATDVYLPEAEPPFPVIFVRTPYDKTGIESLGADGAGRGYAVVVQDTRGRFASEGENMPFVGDGWGLHKDGYDTLEWIAGQAWCNGRIATVGGSATGITQLALAGSGPQALTCQHIISAAPEMYTHMIFPGGVFKKSMIEGWLEATVHDEEALKTWTAHSSLDDFWLERDLTPHYGRVNWPAVHIGGWHDIFAQGTIDAFLGYQTKGGPKARGKQKLIMGPWTHAMFTEEVGELIFPDAAAPPNNVHDTWRWLEYHLKDQQNGIADEPAVTYYVMGDALNPTAPGNEWRTAERWPPVDAAMTRFYLHSDRTLSTAEPAAEKASFTYKYDPNDPVPTLGGLQLIPPAGPTDHSAIEGRPDVLTFTSDPLTEPMEVTGRVRASLWASSDAPDTDFMVRICDVYPDGRSFNVCEGVLRARFRESLSEEKLMEPGQVYRFDLDLWSTSIIFNKGHRLRVHVTSSSSPGYDPNPNTGEPFRASDKTRIAKNAIYLDADRPSHILLPVVKQRLQD